MKKKRPEGDRFSFCVLLSWKLSLKQDITSGIVRKNVKIDMVFHSRTALLARISNFHNDNVLSVRQHTHFLFLFLPNLLM